MSKRPDMQVIRYPLEKRVGEPRLLSSLSLLEKACFSDPWSEGMLKDTLEDRNVQLFTIEEDGTVIAYLMLLVIPPEGEILNLAVLPEKRRLGLGNALLSECDLFCQKALVDTLYLEVRVSNTPAVSLYEKQGFSAIGVRKNYYRAPKEDALVMRKHLPSSDIPK